MSYNGPTFYALGFLHTTNLANCLLMFFAKIEVLFFETIQNYDYSPLNVRFFLLLRILTCPLCSESLFITTSLH